MRAAGTLAAELCYDEPHMTAGGRAGALAIGLALWASTAAAHPAPFSYLDVRINGRAIEGTLVVHVIDIAHEHGIDPADRLLDPAFAQARLPAIAELLARRLKLAADGVPVLPAWTGVEPLADWQALRLSARGTLASPFGMLSVAGTLFPYDAAHQTFVNVYDNGALTQHMLDRRRAAVEYFAGSRPGTFAVLRKFVSAGIHHILIGPDHLLFLLALLLLGGTIRRLALIVTGFTIAHSLTLTLSALDIFTPPARIIEPAIALSIVYVGADNLLVRTGRDFRAWIAFAFGFIHGFGFANVLREMDLPPQALGWSLFSFNVGVEIGQLLVVVVVATALAWLRARSVTASRRLAFAGSVAVMAVGAFWFVQRIAFPGGL